jgi:hypothetical protein
VGREQESQMTEQIVRDCVIADRIARGLADYYSRRTRGVQCRDPLPPEQRAILDRGYDQKLQSARNFVLGAQVQDAEAIRKGRSVQ